MRKFLTAWPALVLACGGGVPAGTADGGSLDARAGMDGGLDVGLTCTAPTVMGGSSGGGNYSMGYVETCTGDASYFVVTTCPSGEVECPNGHSVAYACGSGASGAFAACGLPHQ